MNITSTYIRNAHDLNVVLQLAEFAIQAHHKAEKDVPDWAEDWAKHAKETREREHTAAEMHQLREQNNKLAEKVKALEADIAAVNDKVSRPPAMQLQSQKLPAETMMDAKPMTTDEIMAAARSQADMGGT